MVRERLPFRIQRHTENQPAFLRQKRGQRECRSTRSCCTQELRERSPVEGQGAIGGALWRKEYGGLRLDQAKRLKALEQENSSVWIGLPQR